MYIFDSKQRKQINGLQYFMNIHRKHETCKYQKLDFLSAIIQFEWIFDTIVTFEVILQVIPRLRFRDSSKRGIGLEENVHDNFHK